MGKTLGISLVFHLLLVAVFLGIGFRYSPMPKLVESVSIRIGRESVRGKQGDGRHQGGSPSESIRDGKVNSTLPAKKILSGSESSWLVAENLPVSAKLSANHALLETPERSTIEKPRFQRIGAELDPLEGLETALPTSGEGNDKKDDSWSVSWVNGGYRGILSYPELDPEAIPDQTDRLLNLSVRISVSPQGEVISAAIVEPGSGDVRIDRYMHSLALSFVFEPLPADSDVRDGTLRLLFLNGRDR